MPVRNRTKIYGAEQFYHVYNRGVDGMNIFREPVDYEYMLSLFKKHLSPSKIHDRFGRDVPNYSDKIDLVAYCLMPNHYHLMVYLKHSEGLTHLLRSVMTRYTMYFNRKYNRSGGLFQSIFLASRISNDTYYWHTSRYIHLNPMDITGVDYTTYPFSSIGYFLGDKYADWLHPEWVVGDDEKKREYAEYLTAYESRHEELKELKNILAHS